MPAFYLHEDEWGMINLLPAENADWAESVAVEGEQAASENFAGFVGVGGFRVPTYREIYGIPEGKHPISERVIQLDDLRALLAGTWPEAERVESGYSSYAEELEGAFAFGSANGASGAFYGSHENGIVTNLHIIRPDFEDAGAVEAFEAALHRIGSDYNLLLADWWIKMTLDLRDPAGIRSYLRGDL